MKILLLFLSVLSLCFSAYSQERENSLLSLDNATLYTIDKYPGGNSWVSLHGTATIDPLTLYKGEKSLLIIPDSLNQSDVSYTILAYGLEGDSIRFTGKYKYSDAKKTDITFYILQVTSENLKKDSVIIKDCNGSDHWQNFEVRANLQKAQVLYLAVKTQGPIRMNLSECEFEIDGRPLNKVVDIKFNADNDHEFDEGSGITLGKLTPQMKENLMVLGKVWGFLKYHHPRVVKGNYNWDYELFRIMPHIANASGKNERNRLLNNWIDSYGEISAYSDYTIKDSSRYSRIIKLDWLDDKNIFDEQLIKKLNNIKRAKRSDRNNYYVISWLMAVNKQEAFSHEKFYPNITWKDQGFRILTLFRFWNAIKYCFPYTDITDKPWSPILEEYIPYFVDTKSNKEYELTIRKLIANINDTHGGSYFPDSDLDSTAFSRSKYEYRVPAKLTLSEEGIIVVESTCTKRLERGDILLSVNGQETHSIIEESRPYISASNEISLIHKILQKIMLKSETPELDATVLRKGKELDITLDAYPEELFAPDQISGIKSWKDYNIKSREIIYVDVATMSGDSISKIIKNNINSKGLILDLRSYPSNSSFQTLYSLLLPKEEVFMWFSTNDKSNPGNFVHSGEAKIGTYNPNYFKGKVAILVNEGTQSHGEFSAIAYRKAPRSVIIGSTTAGADGNVALFKLPHDITVQYTGVGAYYPGWEICQRTGVKIDIYARPDVKEIRNGQDILIEKAIKYITD